MVYRMKRNGAGLASICILSTMVLVTLSSTVCLYAQTEDGIQKRYPHDITMELTSDDYSETEPYKAVVSEVLSEYGEKCGKCGGLPHLQYGGISVCGMSSG